MPPWAVPCGCGPGRAGDDGDPARARSLEGRVESRAARADDHRVVFVLHLPSLVASHIEQAAGQEDLPVPGRDVEDYPNDAAAHAQVDLLGAGGDEGPEPRELELVSSGDVVVVARVGEDKGRIPKSMRFSLWILAKLLASLTLTPR